MNRSVNAPEIVGVWYVHSWIKHLFTDTCEDLLPGRKFYRRRTKSSPYAPSPTQPFQVVNYSLPHQSFVWVSHKRLWLSFASVCSKRTSVLASFGEMASESVCRICP